MLHHHVVATLTAGAFLLASIFCACAGAEGSEGGQADQVAQATPAHCHHNDDDSGDPAHQDHADCQHCANLVTVQSNPTTSPDHLVLALSPLHFLSLSLLDGALSHAASAHLISGDLTVPLLAPTLLQLHCALIV